MDISFWVELIVLCVLQYSISVSKQVETVYNQTCLT